MEPKPMPTPDLAGLLSRPRKVKPRTEAQRPEPKPEQVQSAPEPVAPTPSPSPASTPPASTRKVVAAPTSVPAVVDLPLSTYGRNVTLYMPAAVDRAMRAALDESQMSLTGFILTAVNRNHARLGDWLESDSSQPGDLFKITQAATKPGPTARATIRLTEEQLSAVDSLTKRFAVPRTQVLVAAIKAELGLPAQ